MHLSLTTYHAPHLDHLAAVKMQQAPYQYQTAAVPQSSGPAGSSPVFPMPVWVTVVRGFQLFIALVIAVGSGIIIHGLAFDSVVFALVCVCPSHVSFWTTSS